MPDTDDHLTTNNGSSTTPLTAAVAVKPPIFDETPVTRWFTVVESQFILAHITISSTKFHHILSNLPLKVINQLSDEVISSSNYEQLKKALISLFTRSKPELFDSLVNKNKIMCDKPSTYLRELRKIAAQLSVDDSFVKLKFLNALPSNIRPLLVTYDDSTSLEELARVAETLLAYGSNNKNDNNNTNVSVVKSRSSPSYVSGNSDKFQRGSNSGVPRQDYAYSSSNIPLGVRAFHDSQRPKVCRYHLYYGDKAKSCKRWCILSSTSSNILPDSRPSSRSPSPSTRHNQSGN